MDIVISSCVHMRDTAHPSISQVKSGAWATIVARFLLLPHFTDSGLTISYRRWDVLYYNSYDIHFDVLVSPYEAFGDFTLSRLKRYTNALGLPMMGDLFRSISKDGFRAAVPDGPITLYEIKVNRVTVSDLLVEANGYASLYEFAKANMSQYSNCYSSLNKDSDMKLSYIVRKLPDGYDIPSVLDEIELRSERYGATISPEKADGYCYRGIPKTVIVITWMMQALTGRKASISRSYYANMLDGEIFNPYIVTLGKIAKDWGNDSGSFVKAIGKQDLILTLSTPAESYADNSKDAIISRLLAVSGCTDKKELFSKLPMEKRHIAKSLLQGMDRMLQTITLLQILECGELQLSDIII